MARTRYPLPRARSSQSGGEAGGRSGAGRTEAGPCQGLLIMGQSGQGIIKAFRPSNGLKGNLRLNITLFNPVIQGKCSTQRRFSPEVLFEANRAVQGSKVGPEQQPSTAEHRLVQSADSCFRRLNLPALPALPAPYPGG